MHWEAFRNFWKFSGFSDFFERFWYWEHTFTDVLRIRGLTIIGANYWEVALNSSLKQCTVKKANEKENESKMGEKSYKRALASASQVPPLPFDCEFSFETFLENDPQSTNKSHTSRNIHIYAFMQMMLTNSAAGAGSVDLKLRTGNSASLSISQYEICLRNFAQFSKFCKLEEHFRTHSDPFRFIRTHSYTVGSPRKPSEAFGQIRTN